MTKSDQEAELTEQNIDESLETDSLSTGVAFTMGLTVAQRGVGFIRTALFCRLLPEEELGQWSLVFSFVMLCAPMTLLGITGSFGRYVEHYFQRGLLRQFFRRTGLAVTALTVIVTCLMWQNKQWVAWCLFGSAEDSHLLLPALITLATTIAYNFFLEAVIALRKIKVGSIMSLVSSWTFAILGIGLLHFTDLGSYGVVISFAVGNLLASVYALGVLSRTWEKLPQTNSEFSHVSLWKKLAPFAIGLWLVNIVTNLFDMVDRYMIVHFSGFEAVEAQGLVGQYFSSMAVPLLMIGLSTTLAHMVMPYLSEDWEAKRYQAVSDRINLSTKLVGLMLACGSTVIMLVSPFLFNVVFGGKYDAGYAVLPWTIAFSFWKAIANCSYNYLYCVERTRSMFLSLVIGLVANIVLNALLLPPLGLLGAAMGTAIACAFSLAAVNWIAIKSGYRMNRGVMWVFAFPTVLCMGSVVSAVAMIGLLFVATRTTWFLSAKEQGEMEEIVRGLLDKLLPNRWNPLSQQAAG